MTFTYTPAVVNGTLTSASYNALQQAVQALSNAADGEAPLASPAFTGSPTAPTQLSSDNSTKLATTAFVQAVAADVTAGSISGAYLSTSGGTITGNLAINPPDLNGVVITGPSNSSAMGTAADAQLTIRTTSPGASMPADTTLRIIGGPGGGDGPGALLLLDREGNGTAFNSNSWVVGAIDGKYRWSLCLGDYAPETGGDSGSNFDLGYCHDAGAGGGIVNVLTCDRQSGLLRAVFQPDTSDSSSALVTSAWVKSQGYGAGTGGGSTIPDWVSFTQPGPNWNVQFGITSPVGEGAVLDFNSPGPAANYGWRMLQGSTEGNARWRVVFGDNEAESGNSHGSNFMILRCDDAGNHLDAWDTQATLSIDRATGSIKIAKDFTALGPVAAQALINTSSAETTATGGTITIPSGANEYLINPSSAGALTINLSTPPNTTVVSSLCVSFGGTAPSAVTWGGTSFLPATAFTPVAYSMVTFKWSPSLSKWLHMIAGNK